MHQSAKLFSTLVAKLVPPKANEDVGILWVKTADPACCTVRDAHD
jgi:hypothetical protein